MATYNSFYSFKLNENELPFSAAANRHRSAVSSAFSSTNGERPHPQGAPLLLPFRADLLRVPLPQPGPRKYAAASDDDGIPAEKRVNQRTRPRSARGHQAMRKSAPSRGPERPHPRGAPLLPPFCAGLLHCQLPPLGPRRNSQQVRGCVQ